MQERKVGMEIQCNALTDENSDLNMQGKLEKWTREEKRAGLIQDGSKIMVNGSCFAISRGMYRFKCRAQLPSCRAFAAMALHLMVVTMWKIRWAPEQHEWAEWCCEARPEIAYYSNWQTVTPSAAWQEHLMSLLGYHENYKLDDWHEGRHLLSPEALGRAGNGLIEMNGRKSWTEHSCTGWVRR